MARSETYDTEINDDELTIIRTRRPNLRLAQVAQPIGFQAWYNRFVPPRNLEEIRHSFDPSNPLVAEQLYARMRESAGAFVGVVALLDAEPVGYAWAVDEISTKKPFRRFLDEFTGKYSQPYARIAQINTLPSMQNHGIGSVMTREVLAPFRPNQRPAAYVPEENQDALDWFSRRSFDTESIYPEENYDYFPEGSRPVEEWRLEAPKGVRFVRQTIGLRQDLLYPGTPVVPIIETNTYRDPF